MITSWPILVLSGLLASGGSAAASPSPGLRAVPAQEVSALAFNVLYDATEIGKSIDVVEQAGPDIVCFTELTPGFVKQFEARLGRRYPYRALQPVAGTWGVGIASRHPLSQAQRFEERPHQIPAMEAVISVGGSRLRVACLHLFPPVGKHRKSDGFFETMEKNAELRRQQAEYLVARYPGRDVPTLLVGDMNEDVTGKAIATFHRAGFVRSCTCPSSSCGGTFPGATSPLPAVFEIDHILGRGVSFKSARVIRGGGSDHFPVFASFTIP